MELSNILVVNDALDGLATAVVKAAEIEHYSGAAVEVAEVIYHTIAEESPDVLPPEEQARMIERIKAAERNGLRNLVAQFEGHVASLSTRVVWSKDGLEGSLLAARECNADLVIKPVAKHALLGDFVRVPLDWGLMREASCPVLITKDRPWPETRRVLAAVDIGDKTHAALTRDILKTAASWSQLMGAELHIVSVYPSFSQEVSDYQVATDFDAIKSEMKRSRDDAIAELVAELSLDVTTTTAMAGDADVVIAALADELDAAITVIGTSARKGLKKLVFGNTSESIIGHLKGDILTLR